MEKRMKKKILIPIIIILLIIISLIITYKDQTIAVLGYHDFTDTKSTNEMQMEISKFEKQMAYLKKHHYKTITLKEMECFINKTCNLPRRSVLITMDDGYRSNYELAFPVLKKYNLNAVVFYMSINYNTNSENYMNKEIIDKAKKEYPNIEFASHSYNLHHEMDYLLDYDKINEDFQKQKETIDTKYFAYPYGHVSDNLEKALKENDYRLAFTFGPNKEHRKAKQTDDKYHIPRLNISSSMPAWKFKIRLLMPY